MVLFNEALEVIEGTVGTTVKVKEVSSYLGDGDSVYTIHGTYKAADGSYKTIGVGKTLWYNYSRQAVIEAGTVDGDVEAYNEYVTAENIKKIALAAEEACYEVRIGAFAVVFRSSRKHVNKFGRIFWSGTTKFGDSTGVETVEGEKFFVPTYYLACMPWPEEVLEHFS